MFSSEDWASHAEAVLIRENSKEIKLKVKNNNSHVALYTTLEPCLMCLGTAVVHRFSKIVYACPDPHGGTTHIDPTNLQEWYIRRWPEIKKGLFKEEAYDLMEQFMKKQNNEVWNRILKLFEDMKKTW